jgi:ABC-2 type transport system permease protein
VANLPALYLRLMAARVRAQLQYRLSFAMYLLGAFALTFTDFLAIWVIFRHLPLLAGWSLAEVAFLYGTSYISFKATDLAIGHLDQLPQQILSGTFDVVLVRPLGALFQVLTADLALRHVGSLAQGLVVFAYALGALSIDWTVGRAVMLVLMLVSGSVIFAAVWVIGATSVFWTMRSMEALNAFTYGGQALTSYPLNIYGGWLRRLLAFVVPLAFVNYFPSLYILDRPDLLGAPPVLRFLSPLVAAGIAVLAWRVWNVGVRRYRSTGS